MSNNNYNKPFLPNTAAMMAMGINPKTGLPYKMDGCSPSDTAGVTKEQLKIGLKRLDLQTALNRFEWYNLPKGLTGEMIERVLYFYGQGMLFKMNDEFYFLPYALDGSIDLYGRFLGVTPLPIGSTDDGKANQPIVKGLTYKPVYDVQLPEYFMDDNGEPQMGKLKEMIDKSCVLIHDHSIGRSQINLATEQYTEGVIDFMAECLPLMRTALFNSTGVQGIRVGSQDEQANAEIANRSINNAALTGRRLVPIIGGQDFQDLAGGDPINSEEFLLAMQGLDNYRLSLYGLDNGGLFQKRSGMLEAEAEMNQGNVGLILQDSLEQRQHACDVWNSIHGIGIWCEVKEPVIGMDMNGDGLVGGDQNGNMAQGGSSNDEQQSVR